MKKVILFSVIALLIGLAVGIPAINGENKVSLNFITWGPYDNKIFEAWNKKYPDITINYQQINDAAQYNQVLRTRLAGGADLDVAAVRVENYEDFATKGLLLDITKEKFLRNYAEGPLNDVKIGGKIYAVPMGVFAEAVWYNKDLFKKLNLSIPKSYDEFLAVCGTIKKSGLAAPMTQAVKDGWAVYEDALGPIQAVLEKDPQFAKKLNRGEAKFTDPRFVEALKKYEYLVKQGYVQEGASGMDWQAAGKQFAMQKAAMYINGNWNSGYLSEQKVPFEIGVFPMPQNAKGGKPAAALIPGIYVSVIKSSKHQKEALKFLDFMSDKNGGATMYYETTGHLPSVKGVGVKDPVAALWIPIVQGPGISSFRNSLKQAPVEALFIGLQEIFTGTKTPEKVASDLQEVQDKVVNK